MKNLNDVIEKVLRQDARLWTKDKPSVLLKEKLIALLTQDDESLLQLLINNAAIKEHFFKTIDKVTIFQKEKFLQLVTMNEFLPSSFTAFKNKIGLTSNGKTFSQNDDVTLVFPHKDCVLEGGQTKEEQKRDEIFYNTTLAPHEIDRLQEPKILTNAKRISKSEAREITEIKSTDNLVIKGNNLLVLYSLLPGYRGMIKLVYIDPPYNTGNDGFKYNDSFNHSTWLTFIKNRLEVAKELMRDDGVVFVQCDNNEHAYLKVLMDEIFGRENSISQITWERSATAGLGMGGKIINVSEYILLYGKTSNQNNINGNITRDIERDVNDFMNYKILVKTGSKKLIEERVSKSGKPIKIYKHSNFEIRKVEVADFKNKLNQIFRTFLIQRENAFQHSLISCMDSKTLYSVEYIPSRGKHKDKLTTTYYYNKELFSWLADIATYNNGKIIKHEKVNDFWDRKFISNAARGEGDITGIDRMKKPEKLLWFIINLSTQKGDIVLDYHLGSGTTAAVAHKMGRRYIGIEQMDYIEAFAVERLKKVVDGEQGGVSKAINWQGGGDFVYCELLSWNQKHIDELQRAKSAAAIAAIREKIEKDPYYKYQINMEGFDAAAFHELSLKDQKQVLLDCLDLNHLYVNYRSMDDATFAVSEKDKKLNRKFYNQ